jgi:asparagine synthase (glutamine-hydrolysing)
MFAGINALPAAHYADLSLDHPGDVRVVRYWSPDLSRESDLSFPKTVARLRELFLESVDLHLRSDVQIGTLLSGGTDSSSIVMVMRWLQGPSLNMHTFSYIGGQGAISEEPWIDIVNQAAGAHVHKVHLEPAEWVQDATALMRTQAEPFGSIAIYAQNRLLRCAAEAGIKVVLSGQGADELLGGYRSTWVLRVASLLGRGNVIEATRFLRRLARSRGPFDPSIRRIILLAVARLLPPGARTALRRGLGKGRRAWIAPEWCRRHDIGWEHAGSTGNGTTRRFPRELWNSVETLSLPALLRYEDRNGMAYSVESRLPFLTPPLAEFVMSLPEEYLVGPDGSTKRVFKEAMRGIVPDAILNRRDRVGFAVAMDTWVPAIPGFGDLLEYAAELPPLRRAAVLPHLAELRAGRTPTLRASFLLWRLAGFAAWAQRFGVALE